METMELRDYQVISRDHLHKYGRAALHADLGLGKTFSSLAALTPEHLPAVVTAPRLVAKKTWPVEVAKCRPDLRVSLVQGSPAQRKAAMAAPADIYVTGRNQTFPEMVDFCADKRVRTLIIDEASGFKDKTTDRWKAGNKIAHIVPYIWELTGTPAPMGYMGLWAQLFLMDRGQRLGRTLTAYRDRWWRAGGRTPTGVITDWTLRPGAEAEIRERISDICLSLTAETYLKELPQNTINVVDVEMPPAAWKVYRDMEQTYIADLTRDGGTVHLAANAAVKGNRLLQITAGVLYADKAEDPTGGYDTIHSAKLDTLADIVEEAQGQPILVFYAYRAEAERIKERFGAKAHMVNDKNAVDRWNAGQIPILLAHPASVGYGLNLQHGGHIAVWTTTTWSLELWQQANARLARPGQTHPVITHVLRVPGTHDDLQREVLAGRANVQDSLKRWVEAVQAIRRQPRTDPLGVL